MLKLMLYTPRRAPGSVAATPLAAAQVRLFLHSFGDVICCCMMMVAVNNSCLLGIQETVLNPCRCSVPLQAAQVPPPPPAPPCPGLSAADCK